MSTFLGGEEIAGGKMKTTDLWAAPNVGATNSSGFSGRPGGSLNGTFFGYMSRAGSFWTSTPFDDSNARMRNLREDSAWLENNNYPKNHGFSVRCIKDDIVTDIDGNTYRTIKIGSQTWMMENLKTTRYNDGASILTNLDNAAWDATTEGAFAIHSNNPLNTAIYGYLYNWYAVDTGKLAPAGWHVPTQADWNTLFDYLGGKAIAGGKLKQAGVFYWNEPNLGASNQSGFTALPGGWRGYDGPFAGLKAVCNFWSSNSANATNAFGCNLDATKESVDFDWPYNPKKSGYSIRCVKD